MPCLMSFIFVDHHGPIGANNSDTVACNKKDSIENS